MTNVTKQGCFVENKILDRVLLGFGVINVFKGTAAIIQRSGTFHGIFGPGFHTAPWYDGYKVTDILSLDMHLFENAMLALTKDRIPVIVEGFIQYRVVEKSVFDSAGISEVLREAFEPEIEAFRLRGEAKKRGKAKKIQPIEDPRRGRFHVQSLRKD